MSETQTVTLSEFLTARLDEDEVAALEAVGYESRVYWAEARHGRNLPASSVTHYMRHNPDRVLADVAAKRQIMREHHPVDWGWASDIGNVVMCGGCRDRRAPCPTLRLLALPYVDHPNYRLEWRP